jgi:hypothetical protein
LSKKKEEQPNLKPGEYLDTMRDVLHTEEDVADLDDRIIAQKKKNAEKKEKEK